MDVSLCPADKGQAEKFKDVVLDVLWTTVSLLHMTTFWQHSYCAATFLNELENFKAITSLAE